MKKYCPECALPMFSYPILHNGNKETVYRCMSRHGKVSTGRGGMARIRPGTKPRKGIEGFFGPIFKSRLTNADS